MIVITTGKKDTVVCLAGAQSLLRPEKKGSSRLSGGCVINIRPKKKSSSCHTTLICTKNNTGKKSSSHLSGGCAIVITTGKKSSSRLSGGLCCCVSFMFWREIGFVFWFWREIVFGVTYVHSVQYSCGVVSVFLLWRG
jgi:hypothetical protein